MGRLHLYVEDRWPSRTSPDYNWQARTKVGSITSFPLLERRLKMNRIDLSDNIKTCVIEHLKLSLVSFDHFSTMTRCMFLDTETRLTLKLTLMPKK